MILCEKLREMWKIENVRKKHIKIRKIQWQKVTMWIYNIKDMKRKTPEKIF
jgi:hypothetical protein